MTNLRIGVGYDVHKLVAGRDLIIGGQKIPYEKGLEGHSDADVLVHAIIDSLLGAASLGGIGVLFPDTDAAYKNADSLELLKKVNGLIIEKGYSIVNIDSIVIAQEPKLKPHIEDMRKKISKNLGTGIENISIKATTTEHLGFEGKKEGIAAHATCLLEKN